MNDKDLKAWMENLEKEIASLKTRPSLEEQHKSLLDAYHKEAERFT